MKVPVVKLSTLWVFVPPVRHYNNYILSSGDVSHPDEHMRADGPRMLQVGKGAQNDGEAVLR